MLVEVQRALRTEGKGPIPGLSGEPGTGSSDGGGVKDEGDASAIEVTVVRVALPPAAERQQVRGCFPDELRLRAMYWCSYSESSVFWYFVLHVYNYVCCES